MCDGDNEQCVMGTVARVEMGVVAGGCDLLGWVVASVGSHLVEGNGGQVAQGHVEVGQGCVQVGWRQWTGQCRDRVQVCRAVAG